MHVIEVIPLKKGIGIESLSYYSSVPYELGTLISIPIRAQHVTGVVIGVKTVSTAKTALRTATFSLKKLPQQPQAQVLPATLITLARHIATKTPSQTGAILYSILPPDIRNGSRPYPALPDHLAGERIPPSILTAVSSDRYMAYRSRIREAFAHRGSVLFVVPTTAAAEYAENQLSSGIQKRVITFTSGHTKRKLDQAYEQFEDLSQAKLIIATPNFAFLCRHDVTTIIVENAGSLHYVSRARPYLDARQSLKEYAKIIGAEIILGDNLPQAEDEQARREDKYATYEEHPQRLQIPSSLVVARHPKENLKFSIFTDVLLDRIQLTLANRGRTFLYASRRGLAPLVICKDCGHVFRCADSGAPFSLLRTGSGDDEKRWFYSSTSGTRIPAPDSCPDCGGWRLFEQGIGIQLVHDHIKKLFPKTPIILVDHTAASTHLKAKKLIERFYSEKKSILVGSNLALPYLSKPVECVGVISYEAMRSVPTWRADETVFQTLLTLRELTINDLVVQIRTEEDELLGLAGRGLVDQFYDGEIAVRKSLGYPPFSTFVLLTFIGSKAQVAETEAMIISILKEVKPTFYNGPLSSIEKTVRYGLIRIPAAQFPSPSLIAALSQLPPYIKIEMNPVKII